MTMFEHRSLRKLLLAVAVSSPVTLLDEAHAGGPVGGKFHQQEQHYGHYPTVWRTWPSGWQPYHNLRRAVPLQTPVSPEELPVPSPSNGSGSASPPSYLPGGDAAPAPPTDQLSPEELRQQMQQQGQGQPSTPSAATPTLPPPGTEFEPPAVPGLDDPAPAPNQPILPPGASEVLDPTRPSTPSLQPAPGSAPPGGFTPGAPPAQLPPGMEGLTPDALQRGTPPGEVNQSGFAPEGAELPSFDEPTPAAYEPFGRPQSSLAPPADNGLNFVARPREALAERRGVEAMPQQTAAREPARMFERQPLRPSQASTANSGLTIESRNPFQRERGEAVVHTEPMQTERLPVLRPAQTQYVSPAKTNAVRTVSHEDAWSEAADTDVVHAVAAPVTQPRQAASSANPLRSRSGDQRANNPLRR